MIERVESALRAPGVIQPDSRVLCAVSGGPDSMALLHALHALAPRLGFSVCAGHVEHGIRQEASLADAAFVRARCDALNISFFERAVDAPALAREQRLSLEDAARTARYAALFEMADEAGAERIALAHHMDDQAETVLMHLLRGSALSGICGMRPLRDDGVLRPMLNVRRDEVLRYCRENGIEYRVDETNADTRYRRNALRHDVMPAVEAAFPGAVHNVSRTAALLQDEEDFMRACARDALAACVGPGGGLDAGTLLERPLAIRRRAALLWLRQRADADRLDAGHVEALLKLCASGRTGAALDVPGGRVQNEYGRIVWADGNASADAREYPLNVPGETRLQGACVRAAVLAELPGDLKNHPRTFEYLDGDAVPASAVLRTRRTGDVIRPLGMQGRQPLKEYLIDRKVPRALRDALYVLADGRNVLWVEGLGLSECVRVRAGRTQKVLRLEIIRKDGEEGYADRQG